jgi:hypothetical protein
MSVFESEGVLLLMASWGNGGCYNDRRTDVAHLPPMREWRVCGGRKLGEIIMVRRSADPDGRCLKLSCGKWQEFVTG